MKTQTMNPGDKVKIDYRDAAGRHSTFDAIFDSAVNDKVSRVRLNGLNILLPAGAINAVESSDEEIQAGKTPVGKQDRPQGQEPEAGGSDHAFGETG